MTEEMSCNQCKYYDTEEEYCKALSCNPLNCDELPPCESSSINNKNNKGEENDRNY